MFDYITVLAADATPAYDWSSLDLSGITFHC